MKRIALLLLAFALAVSLLACGKVTLHCNGCGKEVRADAKMNEEWIVFCKDCEPELDFD